MHFYQRLLFCFFTSIPISLFSFPFQSKVIRGIRHVSGILDEIATKLEVDEGLLPLPEQLKDLKNINLKHVRSLRQSGGSCGWHALFNAVAIDYLYPKSSVDAINADSIEQVIKEVLVPWLCAQDDELKSKLKIEHIYSSLHMGAVDKLANEFKLKNRYYLRLAHHLSWCWVNLPTVTNELSPYINLDSIGSNLYALKSPQLFFKKLLAQCKSVHFLISAPAVFGGQSNHLVLVSVLFDASNPKPTVLYLDSNNCLLNDTHDFWVLPSAMYQFFKTLDEAAA